MLNSVVAIRYIWIVWFVVVISSCCSRVGWLWMFVYCFPGCLLLLFGCVVVCYYVWRFVCCYLVRLLLRFLLMIALRWVCLFGFISWLF